MLAGLLLAQERMIERMAHGQNVDFGAFSRVLELIDKYVPPGCDLSRPPR